MRRFALLAATGLVVAGAAAPALAESLTSPAQPSIPVWVSDDNGKVCFAISEQVPHCVDTTPVTSIFPEQQQVGPVTVTTSTANNGVFVGAGVAGQPIVGVSENGGTVCVGISLEVPVCDRPLATGAADRPAQALPGGGVVLYHDSTRTVVGYNDIGVVIYSDGTICPIVSTQDWKCVGGAAA